MRFIKPDRFDLLIIALTAGMYLVVLSLSFSAKPLGDLDFYLDARTLAGFVKGYEPLENVGITKAPAPIFFYFIPYVFVPYDSSEQIYWLVGVLWTSIFIVISMLMLRRAGRNLFNNLCGKIACILAIIFPLHLYYSFSITAESLGFISCIVMLYGFSHWFSSGYTKWHRSRGWWLLFIGLSSLLLTRPTMVFVLPLMAAVFALNWFFPRSRPGIIIKPSLILLLFVSIAFFTVTNFAKQFPGKSKDDRQSEYLTYITHMGRFQFRTEPFDWRFWDNDYRKGSHDYDMWVASVKELNKSLDNDRKNFNEVYRHWIIEDIMSNKLLFIRQFLVRTLNGQFLFVNSVSPENFKMIGFKGKAAYYTFHLALNLINIIILLASIAFLIRERRRLMEFWILWMPVAAIILFHSSIYMEPRYMFYGRPCMLLMAANMLSLLIIKFGNPIRKKSAKAETQFQNL